MTSSCSNNGFTVLFHGANEAIDVSDDQCIPCSLQSHIQLLQSKWMGLELLDTPPHHVPDMLDRIQVWGSPWLLHSLNSMVLKELGNHPSSVGTGIGIRENGLFSHIFGQMAQL